MDNLIQIRSFFRRMFSHEKRTFKKYLLLYNESKDLDSNRYLQLFELFEKDNKERDFEYYLNIIYKSSDLIYKETFRKLLERFRDKMYEAYILDSNLYNKKISSPLYLGIMEAKKLLAISHGIIARGVQLIESKRILNNAIKICDRFELFDEKVIFLKLKNDTLGGVYGYYKQGEILREIDYAIECSKALFRSHTLSNYYVFDLQHKSIDEFSLIGNLKEAVLEIGGYFEKYQIKNIQYEYLLLELQLSHYEYDFIKAEKLCFKFIELVLNTPAIFTYTRVSNSYMNLAYTQCFLYKFEDALNCLVTARRYHPPKVEFKNFFKEAEVFIYIYLQQYVEGVELVKELLSQGELGNSSHQISKRNYLLAILHFLTGDYKQSFRLLQETREIEDDKEGWNIGIRLLQIFLTLETEKVDLADQRIESLRKHIERTAKMKSVRKRDVIIFRVLIHLSRSGFDFKDIWDERKKDFALLRSNDPDYRWIPRSHELIIFDQWFESKVKGEPYKPVFPEPVH